MKTFYSNQMCPLPSIDLPTHLCRITLKLALQGVSWLRHRSIEAKLAPSDLLPGRPFLALDRFSPSSFTQTRSQGPLRLVTETSICASLKGRRLGVTLSRQCCCHYQDSGDAGGALKLFINRALGLKLMIILNVCIC